MSRPRIADTKFTGIPLGGSWNMYDLPLKISGDRPLKPVERSSASRFDPRIRRRTACLLLTLSSCFAVALLYTPLVRWYTSSGGKHLTVEEAGAHGLQLELPAEAEDIEFEQHLRPETRVYVEFTLSEDAFLDWTEDTGLETNAERGKPNIVIVGYDRENGRAYYFFRSDPVYEEG